MTTRRDFLKTSTALLSVVAAGNSFEFFKSKPLLSFSTLGCPDWSFDKILDFSVANGYDGIEIRGILRELDLTKCPEFSTKDKINETRKRIEDKKLKIVDLGSSAAMHHPEGADRQKSMDEGKRFIDLAQQLNCPNVRVFPNELPKDDKRKAVIELVINGLHELGEYAKGSNVSVLMESHGDAVKTDELKYIMESVASAHNGLVWDIVNMWTVTKEQPADVYKQLKKYIRHTHIKDADMTADGKINYVLLGKGQTPIFDAIDVLNKDGYKGYYSFEWEKMWHPEILEPEIALADYPKAMKA
ncbi:MAG: sugar phosphate isomerase/epimerase family protein, partial [Bacteroidota bacterium]